MVARGRRGVRAGRWDADAAAPAPGSRARRVKLALALAAPGGGESTTTVASADRIRAGPFGRRRGASRQPHDAELIRDAQRGSEEAIERLFRMHWPRAWRAAYLVVHDAPAAEDIAQEAFLSAIRALERFDRRRPFGPWLHRIVVNRAIDWTRARSLRHEVELGDYVPGPPAPELDGSALGR